ncbi:MAG TPA: dienelactone hydrolase family protein [Vicinamibacterales bacterium]|nr:dienelactone hydrolase family protein [Vicinamibacterales bacterium]
MSDLDPHGRQPVLHAGAPLAVARLVVIMAHGRGAGAGDMIGLAGALGVSDVAFLAPQAAGHAWYPNRFMEPIASNEPWLTSALRKLESLVAEAAAAGFGAERVALAGFSQGACLSLEFAARHARRYAAIAGLSGGLIGPAGTPRDYAGAFDGTPVFLGCSDIDPHIPVERVRESAEVFRRMGAAVDERIYPRMGHTVNQDEIDALRALLT